MLQDFYIIYSCFITDSPSTCFLFIYWKGVVAEGEKETFQPLVYFLK